MKKTLFILLLLAMMLMSNAIAADPTCSVVNPASSSSNTGTINWNASITSNGTLPFNGNVTGVNWSVSSVVIASSTGEGLNLSQYGASAATTGITNTASTTVTANIIVNKTVLAGSCTSTSVAFDNTDPVCSCSLERDIVESGDPVNYDCSTSTDTTPLTHSCVLTYDSANTETETTTKGSFEDTIGELGEGNVVCTATDAVSKTDTCSTLTVTVKGDGDEGIPAAQQQQEDSNALILIILITVVIGAGIFVAMEKAKKGKKKKR